MKRKFQALVGIAMCALTFVACKKAQGRLYKKYKKYQPNERRVFTYAPGNISTVKSYSSANKLNLFVEKQGIDMFLPIFGKASKEMPEHQYCKLAAFHRPKQKTGNLL